MANPDAHATARRNLAYRIDRFLRDQEAKPATAITGWQADRLLVALDMLEAERFPEGEDEMRDAEPSGYVPLGHHEPGQLVERLARVLAA